MFVLLRRKKDRKEYIMSEFLIFSDPHFDLNHSKSYILENGITSWLDMQLKGMNQIFKYAQDNSVFDIFCNGDLFEKKNYLPQNLYNAVWETFEKQVYNERFNFIFNSGNHDYHSKISGTLKPFSNIVDVITKPTDIILEDIFIRVIPFGMVDRNLKLPDEEYSHYILMTHEDIDGSVYGNEEFISSTKYKKQLFSDWFVLNGHIHMPRKVSKRIINLGSVFRNNFGETDKKYFYHYKNGDVKQIEIKCPKFITTPGFSDKIRTTIDKDNYNFYRIDISPEELNDPLFKKYNVFPNVVKIKKKKKRLQSDMTEEEELSKYIEIVESNLDKNKLLEMVKEL